MYIYNVILLGVAVILRRFQSFYPFRKVKLLRSLSSVGNRPVSYSQLPLATMTVDSFLHC